MKRQGRVGLCAICGGSVDMSLSGRTANGPSVDHVVATSAGGSFFDLSNWQLSHRRCNSAKGRGEVLPMGNTNFVIGRKAIPHPYDPMNRPKGCTCRPTTVSPKSPNDIYCDICEAVRKSRKENT